MNEEPQLQIKHGIIFIVSVDLRWQAVSFSLTRTLPEMAIKSGLYNQSERSRATTMHTKTHTLAITHTHTRTHTRARTQTHTHTNTNTHTHTNTNTHTQTDTHTHTNTNTETHTHENLHTPCLPRARPVSSTQAQLTTTQLAVDHAPPPAAAAAADSCHPISRPARSPHLVRRAIARHRDHRSTAAIRSQQRHHQQKHLAPPKWTCSKAANTCHMQEIAHNVLMKKCAQSR